MNVQSLRENAPSRYLSLTKVTFSLWVLPICHSAASYLTIYLTWIDPLDPWSLTLPSYSGLPSSLCTLSLWLGQESALSQILCPTQSCPSQGSIGMRCILFPTLKKNSSVLIAIRFQCLWNLCDDLFWLSTFEKVNALKLWGWFCLKLPCFFLLYFPKISWMYIPRFESYQSQLSQNPGPHPTWKSTY